jgi:hypothetical protein
MKTRVVSPPVLSPCVKADMKTNGTVSLGTTYYQRMRTRAPQSEMHGANSPQHDYRPVHHRTPPTADAIGPPPWFALTPHRQDTRTPAPHRTITPRPQPARSHTPTRCRSARSHQPRRRRRRRMRRPNAKAGRCGPVFVSSAPYRQFWMEVVPLVRWAVLNAGSGRARTRSIAGWEGSNRRARRRRRARPHRRSARWPAMTQSARRRPNSTPRGSARMPAPRRRGRRDGARTERYHLSPRC